ncbi:biopolymer transporter ExbD [uncultured Thiodictyon sp.]|uniref:ExbD/TolR family protein n=1 Tax=uncultured Thiodictyon sp. TaxID=1846217 RepID=UPI0025F6778B|nr:biopolymer transporter ExbD [uncultured Thiodictyon sp.]
MSFQLSSGAEEDEVLSAINTTPLVDVMLVLLIIFLITIPVVTHTAPVALPKETNQPRQAKLDNINLAVAADGEVYWNEQALASSDELLMRLQQVVQQAGTQQPEVQVRGDADAPYEFVGRVVRTCQQAGIDKVGFIVEPPPRG